GVFDHELSAVVLVRVREKERAGDIRSHAIAVPHHPYRTVDMRTARLPDAVAIEHRRQDSRRQCRGHERRRIGERLEDHLSKLLRSRAAQRQLLIVLHARALMARRIAAVDPLGGIENATSLRNLLGGQNIGNRKQHRSTQPASGGASTQARNASAPIIPSSSARTTTSGTLKISRPRSRGKSATGPTTHADPANSSKPRTARPRDSV